MAGIFQTLGTDTTLAIRFDNALRTFDTIIQENLMEELAHMGMTICMCNRFSSCTRDDPEVGCDSMILNCLFLPVGYITQPVQLAAPTSRAWRSSRTEPSQSRPRSTARSRSSRCVLLAVHS